MTEKKILTLEYSLYLLVLGLALAVRLIGLGDLPFNEIEAGWAWQAYQVSISEPVQIGSQPAYVLLTSALFFMFSSSEFIARLLPALMGAMVVTLPFAFRNHLGRKAALIAAFGLALDPIMVAVSRQAGGPMLAVGFAALAAAAWLLAKPKTAGVFSALLLLSGEPAVAAIIAVIAAGLLLKVIGFNLKFGREKSVDLRGFLIAGSITLLLVGTLAMRYPLGLSAMMQGVPDYLSGWISSTGLDGQVPVAQLLVALPIYQPIGTALGVLALLRMKTWEETSSRWLALIGLILLALVAIYPSRQVRDLAWVLPLFWLLAGLSLAPNLKVVEKQDRIVVWAQGITILAFLVFWWANLVKSTRVYFINIPEGFKLADFGLLDQVTQEYIGRVAVLVTVPVVIALLIVFVIAIWSKSIALQGALRGIGIFTLVYVVSVLFGMNDLRPRQANELWNPAMAPGYADDLRHALGELSEMLTGNRDDLEVVYQLDMALLHWQLRDMPNARYAPILGPNETPTVIINNVSSPEDLVRPSGYRGEKIALQLYRSWGDSFLPADFDRWFVYREALVEKQWVVVWAREDIFPGYKDLENDPILESGKPVE